MTSSNGNIFRVTGPLCGEFTGPGEFPTQKPVTWSFDVFFDLHLNKRLSKQPWGWWFETPSWSLWRQCNEIFQAYFSTLNLPEVCFNIKIMAYFTILVRWSLYWKKTQISLTTTMSTEGKGLPHSTLPTVIMPKFNKINIEIWYDFFKETKKITISFESPKSHNVVNVV